MVVCAYFHIHIYARAKNARLQFVYMVYAFLCGNKLLHFFNCFFVAAAVYHTVDGVGKNIVCAFNNHQANGNGGQRVKNRVAKHGAADADKAADGG